MEQKQQEVNVTQVEDEKPALLLAKLDKEKDNVMLLNEKQIQLPISSGGEKKQVKSNLWYLDNGESNHMTGCKSKFSELDEGVTGLVRFGDGSTVEIKRKGTVNFKCKTGEVRTLYEVYYILDLCSNIISFRQMSEIRNRVVLKE